MRIDYTGRGVDITDRIREFTAGKMERLNKLLDEIHDTQVVLSVEKYRHKAEIKFLSHKKTFQGAEETTDMFQSIDRVVDKLESQARKFKDKSHSKKRNTTETIRINVLTSPNVEDRESGLKVIHTDHDTVKPMTLEEAVDSLERLGQEFIIYRNAETDKINLVYRRKDGNIGYIEPGN